MTTPNEILPLTETITPADEAAVAGAVRDLRRDRTPVYPIGGRTRLDYGARPSRPGVGLSLAELNRVIDYPAEDMTITLQAGVTIAELAKRLAEKRQRLPVDVPQADRATIGGVVATGTSGPRRYAHGTIRDYVIGIRAVDGRGTAFASGGRVVKNAAGYDLCKLMVGSLGTLGVITQVTLMVRPMPETLALVVGDVPDFELAERLLAGLAGTQTLPAAVELLTGPVAQANPAISPTLESNVAQLIVGFEGSEVEVEWMAGTLRHQWRQAGVSSVVTVFDTAAVTAWDWLTEFPASVRISLLPGSTVKMIERLLKLDPNCSIRAHAGNGVIGVRPSSQKPDEIVALLGELRPAVSAAGGKMVVLCCGDGAGLSGRDVWGPPGDGATVMQAIKDRFDPDGLLNPGRFAYQI